MAALGDIRSFIDVSHWDCFSVLPHEVAANMETGFGIEPKQLHLEAPNGFETMTQIGS